MMTYEYGTVVLIQFPQSGKTARKQRPAIVMLDIGDADIVVAPVTSITRSQSGDIPLVNLPGTGLIRPSWVRLAKVTTLLKSDIIRALGRLSTSDRSLVTQKFHTLFGDFAS